MNNTLIHVTSVELSKILLAMGISTTATHWWRISSIGVDKVVHYELRTDIQKLSSVAEEPIPAYLTDEMLVILPRTITEDNEGIYELLINTGNAGDKGTYWYPEYRSWTSVMWEDNLKMYETSLPNALAKTALYLKKKELL